MASLYASHREYRWYKWGYFHPQDASSSNSVPLRLSPATRNFPACRNKTQNTLSYTMSASIGTAEELFPVTSEDGQPSFRGYVVAWPHTVVGLHIGGIDDRSLQVY